VGLLIETFDGLDLDPSVVTRDRSVEPSALGGFLALESPVAGSLHARLREAGVLTDYRGETLRFGPAPYLSDVQLRDAMGCLAEAAAAPARPA
jgi:kynureninase